MTAPTRIPLPDHLSPDWEKPEDADVFWRQDRMHYDGPIMHLDDALMRTFYSRGMNHAFELYGLPMRAEARRFWAHHYETQAPVPLAPTEMTAMEAHSERAIGAVLGQMQQKWDSEWLPEIRATLDAWEAFDFAGTPTSELADHVEQVVEQLTRLFEIHFEIAIPAMVPLSLFEELYFELFGDEDRLRPYKLVQGYENKTVQSGNALWRLSQQAAAIPSVRDVIVAHPADDVVTRLEQTDEGRAFLSDLAAYLDEFGRRSEMWWSVARPSWIEDPSPAIEIIKGYLAQPEKNPELEQAALAAEREQLVAEAREQLQTFPQAVRDQFEFLLQAGRVGTVLSEDHGYWLDFRAASDARQVFLEAGRRLAATGAIEATNDVFHLTPTEIIAALRGGQDDLRTQIDSRKEEIERYRGVELPLMVGTQPPGPPPDNPGTRTLAKFFGVPPQTSNDPNILLGAPGSAGVVRGPARIVRTLDDADKIGPGDVMIAETTAPPWTPLFSTVAAVVTDTGGVLSHCAVVAREYGIPAVVGTGFATHRLHDGQMVEVDGGSGVVRIIAE